MGCCGSKDGDSEDEIYTNRDVPSVSSRGNSARSYDYHQPVRVVVEPRRVNVEPRRVNVEPRRVNVEPNRFKVASKRVNDAPKYSSIVSGTSVQAYVCVQEARRERPTPTAPARNTYASVQPCQPLADIFYEEVDAIRHSGHHHEEKRFFQIFFSVLDHVPGHQGIQRRWEREVQRAECESGGRCDMKRVWLEAAGYVKTLQRVKMLVYNKKFTTSDRAKLAEWAAKVVKRRNAEYKKAKAQGKADPNHLKVLEEWRSVSNTVQDLL